MTDVVVVLTASLSRAESLLDGAQRAPHGPLDVASLVSIFTRSPVTRPMGRPCGYRRARGRRDLLDAMSPSSMTGGRTIEEVIFNNGDFQDAAAVTASKW